MTTHLANFARPALLLLALALPPGCAGKGGEEFAELPSAEELYAEGLELMSRERKLWIFDTADYEGAVARFQDVIDNYPYSDEAVLSELRIADSYFSQRRWDEALSYYQEFSELHPEHAKVPYSIFRAALCHARQSRDSNRDQSATKEALAALDQLILRWPTAPEIAEAEALWRQLRTKLGRHEVTIGDFYLRRDEYQSAANRYRSVLNEFPGLGLDAEALYKLGVCYSYMNREDEAQSIFEVILNNYPGSDVAGAAAGLIPAAN